jgi:hypothetical protein
MTNPQTLSVSHTAYDSQLGTFDVRLSNGHLWRYAGVPPELELPPEDMSLSDHVRLNLAGKFTCYRVS